MKVYDRKKKEYVTQEEYDRRYSSKAKNLCRGKRPHNYVLVLPSWVKTDEKYKFNPELYYNSMDAAEEYVRLQSEKLAKHGILISRYGWGNRSRLYVCSVCKKHEYGTTPKTA